MFLSIKKEVSNLPSQETSFIKNIRSASGNYILSQKLSNFNIEKKLRGVEDEI